MSLQRLAPKGYRLIRLLGEGGAASVFMARQASTGQTVALKLLRQGAADQRQGQRRIERFERETLLCAQLHHPHIVRLLDQGRTDQGQLYAVFEFVPGETLQDLLHRKGALSAPAAGELLGQVLDALACAHAQGIVHRDLKPQNIMVTATGTRTHVKILDFGIAALIPDRQLADYRKLTISEETMCSPSYSAPEQLRGEPPTVKTDLYAWGLLFVECLTGKPAIYGVTLAEIFHKQLSGTDVPIPPALFGHPLADLLRKVLRKNPIERAERAALLYEEFRQINLANIVGELDRHPAAGAARLSDQAASITREHQPGGFGQAYQRQQITVLCCSLFVTARTENENELEALEALQRDQLSLCIDAAARYGGYLAGTLGNSLMFYYGYPHVTDNDARRSARTALELVSQVRRRSPLLEQQQGFTLDIRIGIHTGIVLVQAGYLPSGVTPNTAWQLERRAAPGQVLISASARRLLEQYVEFEDSPDCGIEGRAQARPDFSLAGEYPAEALAFRRNGSPERALVGREQELHKLTSAWDCAKTRHGRAALCLGEAGVGKSRLACELRETVRKQGFPTKECRCLPEHHNNALHPFLAMLKAHLQLSAAGEPGQSVERLAAALESAGSPLDWALPIMCSWLALPTPDHYPPIQLSPERQKRLLLSTVKDLVLQIGHERPFLLLIEDIHWIDQTSFELLSHLAEAIPDHAALILMTARPGQAAPASLPNVELIGVGRLSERHAEQLIGKIIADKPIEAGSLRRLCERTDGIPLFVEELTRMLLENKLLVERHGIYQLDEDFDASDVPATLRDLLTARLSRMGSARETAQLAAAIGREFDYALLVEVALGDEATVQADLDQLVAADLVFRQRRVHGDSYIFRHALIRDAAYEALPRSAREQTHARIAHQLETGSEAQIERDLFQLARHFALAAEFAGAVEYGIRSARVFLTRALHEDAINLAKGVQGWIARLPPDARGNHALAINRILTHALMSKYGWADARVKSNAEHALRLLEGVEDARQTAPTLWAIALYHHVASNRPRVRSLTGQLSALSNQAQDRSLRVACDTLRGVGYWIDGAYLCAAQSFDQALAQYDAIGHADHGNVFGVDSRVWAMAGLANVQWFVGADGAAAFALAHAAVAHARALNHIPSLGVALMYLAFLHQYADEREGARATCDQLLELSQKYGLPAVEAYAAIVRCWATSDLQVADQVLLGLKQIGCMLGLTYTASLPAEIEARAGRHVQALARIDACLLLCDEIDEPYYMPELLRRRAIYRAKTACPDHLLSHQDLVQAIALANASGMRRTAQDAGAELRALAEMRKTDLQQQAVPESSPT